MPGGGILHFGEVRILARGSGDLDLDFRDYELITSSPITSMALTTPMPRQPRSLANYVSQGCVLRGQMTELDDQMEINTITIFVKPMWAEFPG